MAARSQPCTSSTSRSARGDRSFSRIAQLPTAPVLRLHNLAREVVGGYAEMLCH
jgi:hypothetical protein